MPGDNSRDVTARLTELEATVRGLTQELVSANERIRTLEAALDDAPTDDADARSDGATDGGSPPDGAGAGDESTKATIVETDGSTAAASGDDEAEDSGSDPDDIIVA